MAASTGVDLAIMVTEPTVSGIHDLERVLDVARHLSVPPVVVINKYDLNPARLWPKCGRPAGGGSRVDLGTRQG